MTDRYADLRAALDAGPASGEWISRKDGRFMNMDGWSADHEDHTFSAAAPIKAGGEVIAIVVDGRDEFNQEMAELKANADYIAAANPDTIRALLAERDGYGQPAASAEPIPEDTLGRLYTGNATSGDQMLAWQALQAAPVAAQAQPVVTQQMTTAARDVLAERRRQVEEEGWTAEHDDSHHTGEMALAAGCYAMYAHHPDYYGTGPRENRVPRMWPWAEKWWKQASPRRMLVKAGALTLAEIERIDRAAARDVLAETECIDHARRIEGEAKP